MAWSSESISSDWASVWSWDSSLVEAKVVDGILISFSLELSKSGFSVGASSRLLSRTNASLISQIPSIDHVILLITDWLVIEVWVSLSCKIEGSSTFFDGKHLISLLHISELFNIWVVCTIHICRSHIWMVLFGQDSVSGLDFLRSSI